MKRNKTIYVSRLLLLCMLTLLLIIVGCGNQSVETEDKSENSKSIEIINLLDENSYTKDGKQMAKAVERLVNATVEDFHEVRFVPTLFKGRYLEESDTYLSANYFAYIGEMKKEKPHGYGVLVEVSACYEDTKDYTIYYIGKFDEGTIEDNYGMSIGGDYGMQYIVYEGKMSHFIEDSMQVCPVDGNVEIYHNLDNTMNASDLTWDEIDKIYELLGDFKVAKCTPEYVGEMENGEYHGMGKVYSAKGNLLEEGEFENGYLIDGKTYEEIENFEEAYVDEQPYVEPEEQMEEPYEAPDEEDMAVIQDDENYLEGSEISEASEVTYFAGEYNNGNIIMSISQWSEYDFLDIEVGRDCAGIEFYQDEIFLDAILIKEGDNFFSVVSNDKALYYGTIYVTEEYIEVTDSGDLGLDGVYTLNYLYIS